STGTLDLVPKAYELKVLYKGGILPDRTTIAKVNLFCGFTSYLVNPLVYNLKNDAKTYPVFVGTSDFCSWKPETQASFITLPVTDTRTGSSTFDFHVSQNTDSERSGEINVALKKVKVKQAGTGCSYSFDPEVVYVQAESQFGSVTMNVSTG